MARCYTPRVCTAVVRLVDSTLINEMKRDGMLGNVGRILCIRDQKALRKIASREK